MMEAALALLGCSLAVDPAAMVDARLTEVRDTDTRFTMTPFDSKDVWEAYARDLRRRILVSSGLWPLPERTPLNAHVEDVATHDDYIVSKVYFEAQPGFLVTGNLYRPNGDGVYPGVACPHGHWGAGRLENTDTGSVAGRCITLARLGAVAFSYDMIGYNDSVQFPHTWDDAEERLWGIHPFAMQLWSSIRVLDFLECLPYVDAERLACTGASGGGTQTFALMAVDPRVKVAAPVNMISCSMQGGCPCENAPILRMNASNMEIGALMAPRPLLMVSATGDWTKETPEVEFPAIAGIYKLYGAKGRVKSVQVDAGHNYNQASREAMYRFFAKWLLDKGDAYAHFEEPPFTTEPPEALRVFPDGKAPEGLLDREAIVNGIIASDKAKWAAILPKDPGDLEPFREKYGAALEDVLGTVLLEKGGIEMAKVGAAHAEVTSLAATLRHTGTGAVVRGLLHEPKKAKGAVLVVHAKGSDALIGEKDRPCELLQELLDQGKSVLAITPFRIGDEERTVGKFPETFLPTDTAYRVHDILLALKCLRARETSAGLPIELIGLDDAGVWCLLASAVDGRVASTVLDANGFDPNDDAAWVEKDFVPCIRSVGDVATAAAMIAPAQLAVFNTGGAAGWQRVKDVYAAVGADSLRVEEKDLAPAEIAGLAGE